MRPKERNMYEVIAIIMIIYSAVSYTFLDKNTLLTVSRTM